MPKKEETFLLVSLEQNEAKKLAQVINNDTCRKILNFLAKKDATETELAEKLKIPISTVHYNLQNLLQAGLVKAEEFHYSKKGKEVNHYSLTNKFIIIAPKATEGIKIKIKRVLPVVLIIAGATAIIQFLSKYIYQPVYAQAPLAREAIAGAAEAFEAAAPGKAAEAVPLISQTSLALWFLYGALFSLVAFIAWEWVKERWGR